jgi:hemoglobin/transferrin/lactoferrin receptor protein
MSLSTLALILFTQPLFSQSLHGLIYDKKTRDPIPDVHVWIVNSSLGTITDKTGRFSLQSGNSNSVQLRISAIGYTTIEQFAGVNSQELQIALTPSVIILNNEVTITAQRSERLTFDVPESITSVSRVQIEEQAPRSSPEALMNETGIWVQKTNHGGGSPIIRGLVGNQVLLLVDGIRLNNATCRYGPNQYLSTVDPGLIERIEATRGSGSVLYGSDALGGVVQIISKTPSFSTTDFEVGGHATGKWMSEGMEKSTRAEVDMASKQVAFLGGFSVRNFGNLVAGGGLGVLSPTGYHERSGDAKLLVRTGTAGLLSAAFQQLTQHDVPRYDQVAQGGYDFYNFHPQIRQLSYLRWGYSADLPWLQSFKVTGSLNRSIEGLNSQRNNSSDIRKQRDEVNTIGLIAEVISNPKPNWHAQSGVEYYFDNVSSKAFVLNSITNDETALRGSYADGSTSYSLAMFTNHQFDWNKFQFSAGTRFNRITVSVIDNVFGNQKINPDALVANAGITYKLHRYLNAIASINTGFRAPNIDDMSKFGTLEANVFEIPSKNLSPERSLSIESGIKFSNEKISGTIAAYQTKLFDLIDRVAAQYNGADLFEGRKVYQKQNIGEAVLRGVEADIEATLGQSLSVFGNLTYTHGKNLTKEEPMRRIPPMFGRMGLRYRHPSGIWMKAEWAMAGVQDRLAAGDKSDVRIKIRLIDDKMPGWDIINVYVGYSYENLSFRVYGQNLMNKAYRVYASGVDGYGRTLGFSSSVRF